MGVRRPEVLVHAALGEDAAALSLGSASTGHLASSGEEALVLTTDPITGAGRHVGWYAVQIACNDVAAMGAAPIGVLATLLLPESANEVDVETIMVDIDRAARELGIEVLGGHTEVAPGLSASSGPLIAMTAVGRAPRERLLASANARPGQGLVLTKAAGLEGTAILATDLEADLRGRVPPEAIGRAQEFVKEISVVKDGLLAAELGAVALHDPTEGGLLGAVWELAEAAGCGYEIEVATVPLRDETRLICRVLEADPLRLISSGALLAATPDGPGLAAGLRARGVEAAVIGRLTEAPERWLLDVSGRTAAGPVERDELWRILEERGNGR
jgi:hydrogenase expression/formation protein HypE